MNKSKLFSTNFRKARLSNEASHYFSAEKPDIPLRQPLEEENKSKRKAAREIFEKEKWDKVMQTKMKWQMEEEKRIEEKKVYIFVSK